MRAKLDLSRHQQHPRVNAFHAKQLSLIKLEWHERRNTLSLTLELFVKQSLTYLKRHVRGNTSILKLQTHKKLTLRHLELYGRRNASTVKLEVCKMRFNKCRMTWKINTSTVKMQEYAKFSLTHLDLQERSYIYSKTAGRTTRAR